MKFHDTLPQLGKIEPLKIEHLLSYSVLFEQSRLCIRHHSSYTRIYGQEAAAFALCEREGKRL